MKIAKNIFSYLRSIDLALSLICLIMSGISVILIYGIYDAGFTDLIRERQILVQIIASLLGVAGAVVISLFDYRELSDLWKLYIPAGIFFMVLTYFIGVQPYAGVDDRAWLNIPFVGLTFQPSEILKLAFILSFALHLEKVGEKLNQPYILARLIVHGAVPTILILLQGDDGSALVMASIFVIMIFAAGLSWKYIALAVVGAIIVAPIYWYTLSPGKQLRILTVFNPDLDPIGYGYQQRLGTIAIGAGETFGTGIFYDSHYYVPKMHNDFIFSFLGESFGFIGTALFLFLLSAFLFLILKTAYTAKDVLGRYICIGVFAVMAIQTLINVGMCLTLMPVIGVTLPLLSAGGTSVTMTYLAIGLVLSVHRHSNQNLFI